MSDPVEASGRTVEEAIDAALELLGATEDEVEVQILSEGDDGDPLRRTGDARVLVRFRDERTEEDHQHARLQEAEERDRRLRVDRVEAERQAAAVRGFLEGLMDVLDIDADVHVEATAFGAAADLEGEDLALLIGRHGLTLAALQELCRAVAQKDSPGRALVTVDIEGYLVRRAETLQRMARNAASKVLRTKRAVALEPMNARDRKIVHDALTDLRGVGTSSEGDEPNRFVVVLPE